MNKNLRKTLRSTLSVILVVAMVLSSTALVFAVEPEKKLNVVSLGDSMTTAFGYDDYYLGDCGGSRKPEYKNESGHQNVRGFMVEAQEAYPAKVIDSLEKAGYTVNFNQLAANALRMNDLYYILNPEDYEARKDHFSRRLLDEDSDGEEWFAYWGNRAAANYKDGDLSTPVSVSYDAGRQNGLEVLNTVYKDAITDADVVTLNIGYNNFGVYLTGKLTDDLGLSNYRDYTDADSLQACIDRIGADVDVEEVKAEIYDLISENLGVDVNEFKEIDLGAAKIDLDSYVDVVLQAYIGYAYYFTRTIDQITEWNPDAKIVVVGLQNTQRGLVVRVNGQDIDLGDFYGKLLDMANVYAALVSPNNDKYYFVDLADVIVERLFDELAGDFTEYSDDLKHRLFEGIASFGLDDMINGMIMSSPDFMNGIYNAIVEQSGGTIPDIAAAEQYFNTLDPAVKKGYTDQALSTARSSFGLTGSVDAAWLQAQYDAFVSDPYHATLIQNVVFKIVDILADSARVEYVDFDEAVNVLGAAGGDMVGAIGSAIANYVGGGELNDGIKGLLCIYVRLMLSNGIWVHPSEDGHQTVADEILKVLNPLLDGEDVDTAREYAIKKLISIVEGLVEEYGDDVLNAAVDAVNDFDDTYGISQRVINAAKKLAKSLEESAETLVEPALVDAYNELIEIAENLNEESVAELNSAVKKLETATNNFTEILKDVATERHTDSSEIEAAVLEVKAALDAVNNAVKAINEDVADAENATDGVISETLAKLDDAATAMAVTVNKYVDAAFNATNEILDAIANDSGNEVIMEAVEILEEQLAAVLPAIKDAENEFVDFLDEIGAPAIASAVTELNKAVAELESLIGESYEEVINGANEAIIAAYNSADDTADKINAVKDTVAAIVEKVIEINNKVKETIKKIEETAEKVNDIVNETVDELNEAIKAFDEGIYNGIENLKKYVAEPVAEKIDEIKNEIETINTFLKLLYDASTSAQYVPNKNSYYLAIGDSIATGLGLEGSDGPDWNAGYGSQLDTAYPQVLAEMFGLNDPDHHNVIGMGGVRVEDILYILDPNAEPDDYFTKRTLRELQSNGVCYWGETAGGEDTLNAARAYFASEIGKADLITLTLGGNNFGTFVGACMDNYLATGSYGYDIDFSRFGNADIAKMLEDAFDNGSDALIEALRENGAPEEYLVDADTALAYAKLYVYAYLGYAFNYGKVVEAIHAYNPDALVVITGLYNTLAATYFEKDGIYLPTGDIVGVLVDAINLNYLGYAMYSTYNGHKTVYVDISNTKMFADEDENRASTNFADGEYLNYMTEDRGKISHPNKEGQEIIAQDIYDAIAGENPKYEISGNVTSYINATDEVTVRLLDTDGDEYATTTTTDGTYSLEAVAGDYTIEVSKYGHTTREYEITVNGEAVTQDLVICPLGDATLDGVVNSRDLSRIYAHVNQTDFITDEYAFKCANVIYSDDNVNTRDLSRVYAHVNKTDFLWQDNSAVEN